MTMLDMDQGLVSTKGSSSSLEVIWKQYVAITKALSILGDVDWTSGVKKPSQGEIMSIYVGRSTFYEQSKVLHRVKHHPRMVEWLERTESDLDATTELWGVYKTQYVVKDLEKWLEIKNGEAEKKKKGKKVIETSPSVKKTHKKLRK